jgi:SAM-dependent methyltransferase
MPHEAPAGQETPQIPRPVMTVLKPTQPAPSAGPPKKHRAAELDFRWRSSLSELMDEPCSRSTMQACLRDLARVNRWFLAYRPILCWLDRLHLPAHSVPLRILDVGCGYGDTLRRIELWAYRHAVPVELTGLDLNPDSIAIAAEVTPSRSRIRWVAGDVFQYRPVHLPHLVVSSLFTHHLTDGEVIRFLRWMESNALLGWFVNDLARAAVPYHLFRWFSRAARLHPFVQHDGPVSIARAFSENDWHRLSTAAGLAITDYAVRGYTPARLCVARSKSQ